jgi:ubiquinone/menaquinone biosynthesis C-methylase UbiE
MKRVFDKYYKKFDAWYDKNRFVFLSEVRVLKKALPKRGEGLEIGVGTGRFASSLGIKNGIDPSLNMLKVAKRRGVNVRLGKGEKVSFKDESFDYVAIIITLCFVRDVNKVISEARRVLRPKGKIIIAIVDRESFLGVYYRNKKSIFYKKAKFFSVGEVKMILSRIGFKKFSFYQTLSKLPQDLTSVEAPKEGYGRGGFVVISAVK